MNKGSIYISETSPASVAKAYLSQFRRDFSLFLRSRSEETVAGGRMVLSFIGRGTTEPWSEVATNQWQFIAQALGGMVLEVICSLQTCSILLVVIYFIFILEQIFVYLIFIVLNSILKSYTGSSIGIIKGTDLNRQWSQCSCLTLFNSLGQVIKNFKNIV